ncbi:MAG: hypothetical protein GC192_20970 [Bacteroidetes bacterium]|nr:hypothetical protein [Bacteroidota bacterium]
MRFFIRTLFFTVCLFIAGGAFSQQTSLGLTAFYHLPTGSLRDYYDPAPGYAISFWKKNKFMGFRLDYELGYTNFSPSAPSFKIEGLTNIQGASYAVLTDFLLMHLSIGAHGSLVKKEKFKLYAGANIPYIFYKVRSEIDGHSGRSAGGTKSGLVPKLGVQIDLAPYLSLTMEGRYNFTIQFQEAENVLPDKKLGFIDTYFTLGIGMLYHFNQKQ